MYWGEGCAVLSGGVSFCWMHVTGSQASSTSFVQCKRQFGRIDVSPKLTQKVRPI
jgi:hypothetical protein